MVEVLMGMLLLALATFAVINGLEGAQATGKTNKQRTVAAALAQQDIERLRAYPIASLSNFTQSRAVNIAGVSYTVESKTEWIRDSTNALNCTDQTGEADYVKISSTVKSPAQLNPVKEVSLLTPAAGSLSDTNGTLAVKVTNRSGVGRSGAAVTLTGPTNYTKATNSLGCAVFDYIPIGTYAVGVPGMVTWAGTGAPDPTAVVVGGKTSLKAVEVEPPASLRALLEQPNGTLATWNRSRSRTPSSRAGRRASRWPPRPRRSTARACSPSWMAWAYTPAPASATTRASGSRTTSRTPARAT